MYTIKIDSDFILKRQNGNIAGYIRRDSEAFRYGLN